MKNSSLPVFIFILLLLISCKDNSEGGYDPVTNTDTESFPPESDIEPENDEKKDNIYKGTNESDSKKTSNKSDSSIKSTPADLSGTFIKVGEESDSKCGCYCLVIDFNAGSEMCLVKDEMYINTRFQKTNENTIDVYLIGPSTRNKQNDVPFEKFDKNNPIATIAHSKNGELELNWLGFKAKGDIVAEYAIYGKKTLEGTYRRK